MSTRDPYATGPIARISEPHPHAASWTQPNDSDPQRQDPIRRGVATRLALAGRRHVRHRTDPVARWGRPGPHAVVFLFREPTSDRGEGVIVATRTFPDDPEAADISIVLSVVTAHARDYGDLPRSRLIDHIVDHADPQRSAAPYVGVAVSSIDITRETSDPMPWDGLAYLDDGTRMSLHATRPEIPPDIVSTHTLDTAAPTFDTRTWRWATGTTSVAAPARPDLAAVHDALTDLHEYLCTRADQE